MNSSGIKRGLALAAISALAVTGVPAIANAATLATQNGAGVELRSTDSGNVSVVNDGTNTTVSLVATADATVQFVTFTYGAGIVIGTTGPAANGEFQLEWTPPVGLANTTVTATATDAAGNNPGASDAEAVVISGTLSTVEINKPNGDTGYFAQPGAGGAYGTNNDNVMAISGTTSDSNDTLAVTGLGVEAGSPAIAVPALPAGETTQSFVGTVDVDATALAGTPDRVLPVLTTDAGTGTADAQGFGLYAQQIRNISATQAPVLPNSQTTTVTVKVVDQNGAPVAGAHVVADQGGADGFTNGRGEVSFANVPVGERSYYADTTDEAGFQVGTDFRTSITVGASTPSTITYTSRDGDAFDIDEFDAGDSFINVKDAAGTNLPGQTFFYTWTFTPFETANSGDSTQTTQEKSVTTDANGNAVVPLPVVNDFAVAAQTEVTTLTTTGGTYTLNGYINRGTNPGQDPADLALTPKSIKVGESDVFFDGPTTTTRQLETSQDVVGRVRLFDGTALGGRTVSVSYAPGDDSVLAATQPSGTTRLSNTAATAVTAADGTFTVSVNDPNKTPDTPENGTLSAVGTATVGSGANQKNGIGTDAGTAPTVGFSAANDNVTIQFSADAAGRFITLTADTDSTAGEVDPYEEIIGNAATPGRPVSFEINLQNSQSNGLAGQQVTLKTSNGFFTPNVGAASANDPSGLTADPAPAEGGQYGEWASLGDTITVTTDAAGRATVTVAIERDAGFDDDGRVVANITATSGTATNTNPISVDFRTDNTVEPLNAGPVEVVANEGVNARNGVELPDARVGQGVRYDLFAKDQFGNLVADEVNISDDTLDATVTGEGGTVVSQFANSNGVLTATATDETDQVVTATWNQPSTVYTDANAATPGFQPSVLTVNNTSKTDSADAINWYVVDFAASTFSLSTEPEGDVAVGAPIVETVTVLDQLGKPVPGLQVAFVRQGPGDTSGDPNAALTTMTNANGQAFYAFTGTEPGVARVSAAVTDGTQVQTLSDEITIVPNNGGGGRVPVEALIAGDDNGGRKDVIRFQVDEAAEGATVRLFKIVGKRANRETRQIRSDIVPAGGELTFKIADRNGGKVTRYVAKVSPTDASLREKSNTQKIR